MGCSPTSCLPCNPLRNYGSQNILEVLHHFTIKRSEIEPMKKTKIASRKMASTAGFLPPAVLQPHIWKPWGHLAACLSFIPHRRPGRGSSRTAGPEEVHRAQPARKRLILHSHPGRGDASLPPAPLCSLLASLAVQALVPSHMSSQQSSWCVFLCGHHCTVNMLPLHRRPVWLS